MLIFSKNIDIIYHPPICPQTEDLDFGDNVANTLKIDVCDDFDISPSRGTIGGWYKLSIFFEKINDWQKKKHTIKLQEF